MRGQALKSFGLPSSVLVSWDFFNVINMEKLRIQSQDVPVDIIFVGFWSYMVVVLTGGFVTFAVWLRPAFD